MQWSLEVISSQQTGMNVRAPPENGRVIIANVANKYFIHEHQEAKAQ